MTEAGMKRATETTKKPTSRRRRATRSGEHALRTLVRKADGERPPLDAEYLAMHRIAPLYGEDEPEVETDGDSGHKKRTVRARLSREKAAAKKATTGKRPMATKKAATKSKRVSASKAKERKDPRRVKALVPRKEVALVKETPPVEVVEVTTVEVIAVREPGTAG
jgi:hypothetical protein